MPELPASWIGHWPTLSLRNGPPGCNRLDAALEIGLVRRRPAGHLAFGILHRFVGAVSHSRASSSFVMASDWRRSLAG